MLESEWKSNFIKEKFWGSYINYTWLIVTARTKPKPERKDKNKNKWPVLRWAKLCSNWNLNRILPHLLFIALINKDYLLLWLPTTSTNHLPLVAKTNFSLLPPAVFPISRHIQLSPSTLSHFQPPNPQTPVSHTSTIPHLYIVNFKLVIWLLGCSVC